MRAPRIGGARLPYPDLPLVARLGIERALRWAWNELCRAGAVDPRTATEDALTEELQRRLNDIDSDGRVLNRFTGSLFEVVQRGGSYKNYSGEALNRSPDLVFRPFHLPGEVENATDYGLFVECKIVGGRHPVGRYLRHGLRRFVRADYAWAMAKGLMVAYARGGVTIAPTLTDRLARGYRVRTAPCPRPEVGADQTYLSVHARNQVHRPTGQALGDIEVAHLWLPVPLAG